MWKIIKRILEEVFTWTMVIFMLIGIGHVIFKIIDDEPHIEASQVMVQIREGKYVGCFSDEGCRWKKETITLQQAFDMLNLKYTPPTETKTEAKLEFK